MVHLNQRINNNDVVNFKDGNLTTANVTKTPNGTIVKFDVNTTNITTNATTGNATATNPNNIATAGDVTSAIIMYVICQLLLRVIPEVRSKN